MSDNQHDEMTNRSSSQLADRIFSAVVALAALGGAWHLVKVGLAIVSATTGPALVRDHAPALLGLPVLIALATAIVYGTRTLDSRAQFGILGLRADGAGATILSWIFVFSTLVITLRALW